MEKKQTGGGAGFLKVLVGLLSAGILGLGYYTYTNNEDYNEAKQALTQQKEEVINELEGLKVEYDQAIQEKGEVSKELTEAKGRIEALIDEVKKQKRVTSSVIKKYKKQIYILKQQRDELYKVADSLRLANMDLVVQKDSITKNLTQQKEYNDELLNKNEKLADVIEKAKVLYPTNLVATGVKIRRSGKVIETARRRRAQQVRVCFTIPQNDILEYGNQIFYVRVVNPDGVTIGTNQKITVDENEVAISEKEIVVYENKALNVCVFVKPQDKDAEIIKGNYSIEIYNNGNKVGTTDLTLK